MNEYRNLEDVFKLYEKHGSKGYIGEPISQYEHAMQAALLAEDFFKCAASNVNSEVILGAFLKASLNHLGTITLRRFGVDSNYILNY